jgi:hypothetical protein
MQELATQERVQPGPAGNDRISDVGGPDIEL